MNIENLICSICGRIFNGSAILAGKGWKPTYNQKNLGIEDKGNPKPFIAPNESICNPCKEKRDLKLLAEKTFESNITWLKENLISVNINNPLEIYLLRNKEEKRITLQRQLEEKKLRQLEKEKRKQQHLDEINPQKIKDKIVNKISQLNTIKIENYNIFRLMNPYEGHDKDFYHGDTGDKSRSDSNIFYTRIKELEKELDVDFIYLRGDQFAGGINTYGIMLITDDVLERVVSFIESIIISDGTFTDHFWLEPFTPPDGSFIKLRIIKEVKTQNEKLRKIEKL